MRIIRPLKKNGSVTMTFENLSKISKLKFTAVISCGPLTFCNSARGDWLSKVSREALKLILLSTIFVQIF